jgi:hypothetical protein
MTNIRSLKALVLLLELFDTIFNLPKALIEVLITELDALSPLLLVVLDSRGKCDASNQKFEHQLSIVLNILCCVACCLSCS